MSVCVLEAIFEKLYINIVIVSEYKAPSDFKKIYEKTKVISGTGNNDLRSVRTERLFMYKN